MRIPIQKNCRCDPASKSTRYSWRENCFTFMYMSAKQSTIVNDCFHTLDCGVRYLDNVCVNDLKLELACIIYM